MPRIITIGSHEMRIATDQLASVNHEGVEGQDRSDPHGDPRPVI
jgi:hypothetical protein